MLNVSTAHSTPAGRCCNYHYGSNHTHVILLFIIFIIYSYIFLFCFIYIYIRAVQKLIAINRIQNKSQVKSHLFI